MMKKCSTCGVEKPFSEFHKCKTWKDGYQYDCKECRSKKSIISYNLGDKEKQKQYRSRNSEILKLKQREYREKNKERIKIKKKEYNQKNKDLVNAGQRTRRNKNKDLLNSRQREKRKNNKELMSIYSKRKYELAKSDPDKKLKMNIRRLFCQKLSKQKINKNGAVFSYTGISMENYLEYLHADLLWPEYAENKNIHIDHIIPCSLYDFSDVEEIKKCWDKRNLRLLPAAENISKNNKLLLELVIKYDIYDLLPKKLLTEYKI